MAPFKVSVQADSQHRLHWTSGAHHAYGVGFNITTGISAFLYLTDAVKHSWEQVHRMPEGCVTTETLTLQHSVLWTLPWRVPRRLESSTTRLALKTTTSGRWQRWHEGEEGKNKWEWKQERHEQMLNKSSAHRLRAFELFPVSSASHSEVTVVAYIGPFGVLISSPLLMITCFRLLHHLCFVHIMLFHTASSASDTDFSSSFTMCSAMVGKCKVLSKTKQGASKLFRTEKGKRHGGALWHTVGFTLHHLEGQGLHSQYTPEAHQCKRLKTAIYVNASNNNLGFISQSNCSCERCHSGRSGE